MSRFETLAAVGIVALSGLIWRSMASGADAPNSQDPPTTAPLSVPDAPTHVTAVALSCGEVEVFWQNNASNETQFKVQRQQKTADPRGGPGAWINVATVNPGTTEFVDSGVSASTTYTYRVIAANAAGDSSADEASAATPASSSHDRPHSVSIIAGGIHMNYEAPDGHPQNGYFDFHRVGGLDTVFTAGVKYDGSVAKPVIDYSGTLPTTVTFYPGVQDVIVPVVPANGEPSFGGPINATLDLAY